MRASVLCSRVSTGVEMIDLRIEFGLHAAEWDRCQMEWHAVRWAHPKDYMSMRHARAHRPRANARWDAAPRPDIRAFVGRYAIRWRSDRRCAATSPPNARLPLPPSPPIPAIWVALWSICTLLTWLASAVAWGPAIAMLIGA